MLKSFQRALPGSGRTRDRNVAFASASGSRVQQRSHGVKPVVGLGQNRSPILLPLLPSSRLRPSVATAAHSAVPEAEGLFNPANDKDACGVGTLTLLARAHALKNIVAKGDTHFPPHHGRLRGRTRQETHAEMRAGQSEDVSLTTLLTVTALS